MWIPRYKYRIPSNIGSTTNVKTPPIIDVVFETGLSSTGVDEKTYREGITDKGTNENYYTHPAFRDGSKVYNEEQYDVGGWDNELTGIWVGKYYTGGTANEPVITTNATRLIWQSIEQEFVTSIKFNGGVYNSDSKIVSFNGNRNYGLSLNVDTHMMKNTEYGAVIYLSQSKYGNPTEKNPMPEPCYNSMTGTIYGVCDITKGWEQVMSHLGDRNYEKKYYDYYPVKDSYILGDATYETQWWNGISGPKIGSYGNDYMRGLNVKYSFSTYAGGGYSDRFFRTTLIP